MRTLFLSLVFIMTISCHKENGNSKNSLADLELIRKYIPLIYYDDDKKIIFINEHGDNRQFNLSFTESQIELPSGHIQKKENFNLFENENYIFSFTIVAQTEFNNDQKSERLYISFLSSINGGLSPIITLNELGENWFFSTKLESIVLLGREFKDVYKALSPIDDLKVCNEFYYTINQGIVGFIDDKGELWALKEII